MRFTRRHVLQAALGSLAASCGSNHGDTGDVDILILGAGMAGLSAASALKQNGTTTFRVLEARDRLGGRIHTDRSSGVPIDLGAAWVHYATDPTNPLMGLLTALGVTPSPTNWDPISVYDDQTGFLPAGTVSNGEMTFQNALAAVGATVKGLSDQDVSLGSLLDPKLAAAFTTPADQRLLSFLRSFEVEDDDAASIDEIGAYDYVDYDPTGTDDPDQLVGGYDVLVNSLATGVDVRLSTVVTTVQYDEGGVTVVTNQGTFRAKKAIITFPLGVLRAGSVTFDPALPPEKVQSFQDIGFGHFEKVVLLYDAPFWSASTPTDGLGYASAETSAVPLWADLQAIAGVPALVAMITGQAAIASAQLSDADLVAAVEQQVTTMFGAHAPPKQTVRTQWSTDPFALGCYSFPAIPDVSDAITALAAPVGTTLFWAGEATDAKWYSYVHGAYLSGQRAAREALG